MKHCPVCGAETVLESQCIAHGDVYLLAAWAVARLPERSRAYYVETIQQRPHGMKGREES